MSVFWLAGISLFVRSIPAHFMAYYPFRDRLRVPLRVALTLTLLIQIGHSFLYGYIMARAGNGRVIEYGFSILYMFLYFFFVRDNRAKTLFLYISVTDYVLICRGVTVFLETRFFYRPNMNFNSGISILLNLAALAATAPFMFRLLSNAKEKAFSIDAPKFWRTIWMIPAFTTVIVMIFTARFDYENTRSLGFLFSRLLLLPNILVVYAILLDALDNIRRQAALTERAETQEQLLNLQQTQYKQIIKYMEDIKEIRHDFRQHLRVMQSYLEQDDLNGLKHYLQVYKRKLPDDIHRTFTRNFALNAVCMHFAEEARKYAIDYDVQLNAPEQLPISEPEICALLGNLLENAVEACREVSSAPFIKVRGIWEDDHMVITVDNSCKKAPIWEGERLRSSKRDGLGVGTWAVRRAAERSGGAAKFIYQDGVFYSSVILYG